MSRARLALLSWCWNLDADSTNDYVLSNADHLCMTQGACLPVLLRTVFFNFTRKIMFLRRVVIEAHNLLDFVW